MTYGPGIHERVPFDTYREWPHLNATTLLWGLKSPKHLKAAIDGELDKDSDDLRFGRALHCRLLEPDIFEIEWMIATPCSANLKSGDRKGEPCGCTATYFHEAWFCGKHKPPEATAMQQFITEDESARIERCVKELKSHDVVKLLRQGGGFEASCVWDNSDVRFKCRIDKLIRQSGSIPATILDPKKVQVGMAGEEAFSKTIHKRGYHIRAAMQFDCISKLTGEKPHFIWLAIEDGPPYGIGVWECDLPTLEAGRSEFNNLVQMYKACSDSGVWPGYSTKVELINAPDWYLKRFAGSWE